MSNIGDIMQRCLMYGKNSLTNDGALVTKSGTHTGRTPGAKFIVKDSVTENTVDWEANQSMSPEEWEQLWVFAQRYVYGNKHRRNDFKTVYAAAGKVTKWQSRTRKVFKFICEFPKQELFIDNMFSEADDSEACEGEVFCIPGAIKDPIVAINFLEKKIIIVGTHYLGEIKKSVFTYMNYILTDSGILPMHCSVNVNKKKKSPAVFFGLSGTGKTTLSSSPDRILLGDDEHGWAPGVLFNIEGGCYAKTIDLSHEREPEIFRATNRFGTILENVCVKDGIPDFSNDDITRNGRASYPLSHLDQYVKEGVVFKNPDNVIMLTCDAFGVLPPVARLSTKQARDMFLIGYTSKVAGTEAGVTEPQIVFSSCFGAPFLPRHPTVYGDILQEFIEERDTPCWLVNTGWTGGSYETGSRMSLQKTRKIIKSILDGTLEKQNFFDHEYTGFKIPALIPDGVNIQTSPESTWNSLTEYQEKAAELMEEIKSQIEKFN